MIGIYKITNPKGKIYIGQSINVEKRLKHYKRIQKESVGTKILNSLIKYGIENHTFDLIEECEISLLNEREEYWINYYNSVKEGLNIEFGGGNKTKSIETKEKIKKSKIGKNTKKIKQYTLKNQYIKTWNSITEAEEIFRKGIKGVLSGKTYTAGGYIWRYENELLPLDYKFEKNKSQKKEIIQMDLNGNYIKEWESIISIQNHLGFSSSNISNVCNNKQKTAYGYKWKYKNCI